MYVLKLGKYFYCGETEDWYAGWEQLNTKISNVFLTKNRNESLRLRKILRKKYCASINTVRLVKLSPNILCSITYIRLRTK